MQRDFMRPAKPMDRLRDRSARKSGIRLGAEIEGGRPSSLPFAGGGRAERTAMRGSALRGMLASDLRAGK